jgi:general L-amino acid transport system permease protein
VIALALSAGVFRFNRKHQIKTGQLRRTWPTAAVLIVSLPLLAHWLFGAALHWDIPHLRALTSRADGVNS